MKTIDLISDLKIEDVTEFDWEHKSTSLYCIIAGNLSSDYDVLYEVLATLSKKYVGVFYIDGSLEHESLYEYEENVEKIKDICDEIPNVVYLHDNVVVMNGIAFIGINGWYNSTIELQELDELHALRYYRNQDIAYLGKTLKGFQDNEEVDKIIVISSSVPNDSLMFDPALSTNDPEPCLSLVMDFNHKVNVWLYGGSSIPADTTYENRRFVNNPKFVNQPYWPKCIEI
jgi:hypothetical protein